jgi:hypothetical protein
MANGEGIVAEVKELLSEDRAISTKSALRMALAMQVELHKVVKAQGVLITANSKRLEKVENSSIIIWAQRHPKLTLFFVTLVVILGTILDLRVVIAKALNIDI